MGFVNMDAYASMSGREIRELCRRGSFDCPTSGAAMGFTQVNLVILRRGAAAEFEEFCRLNPKPCPLLEVTEVGSFEPRRFAPGADLRTDLPRYRVYRNGVCADRPTDLLAYWPSDPSPPPHSQKRATAYQDWIGFLIGCSFTFEAALLAGGVPVRHIEEGRNVPMYRTNRPCKTAGRFHGPLVVSMRPMTPSQAEQAVEITSQFPDVHGAPIQIGDTAALGIADLARPDYGNTVTIRPGEIPVFWACGVTPMEAILRANLDIAITHEPGHMLVTDQRDADLRRR